MATTNMVAAKVQNLSRECVGRVWVALEL